MGRVGFEYLTWPPGGLPWPRDLPHQKYGNHGAHMLTRGWSRWRRHFPLHLLPSVRPLFLHLRAGTQAPLPHPSRGAAQLAAHITHPVFRLLPPGAACACDGSDAGLPRGWGGGGTGASQRSPSAAS